MSTLRGCALLVALWFCPLLSAQATKELAVQISRGQFAEAVRTSEILLAEHPDDARVWTLKGIALGKLGKTAESLDSFTRALKMSPEYLPALEGAAQVAYSQHDARANSFLNRIVAENPDNPTAHAMLGVLDAESHDCRAAVIEFGRAAPAVNNNPSALTQYGTCLLTEARAQEAVTVFQRLVTLLPKDASAKYKLALSLHRVGNESEALDVLKALPADSRALNLMARCYEDRYDFKSAIKTLREAIQIAPSDEQNYVDLGVLYIDRRLFDAALETANQGLRRIPDSPRLYTIRGAAYTWLGSLQRAADDFTQADRLEPEQLYGSVGLSMMLRQNRRLPEAIAILRNKLAKRPSDSTLNYLLADSLVRAGTEPNQSSFKEAVSLLQKCTAVDPNFQKAHVLLGKLYLKTSRQTEALREFRTAVHIDPHDRSALSQLVPLLFRMGQTGEASKNAEQLRSLVRNDIGSGVSAQ